MIKSMYQRGLSISEIAELTGHNRRTVRKVVNGSVSPALQRRKVRQSKLAPFVPYLRQRIAEGILNCNKLYDEIAQQGYPGGRSLVKNFVQPYRAARQAQATVRYETAPGEQAQADWAHFGFIAHHGHRRRLYLFVMTLGWSRAMYIEFTISADTAWWLRCHGHAFAYFGGVPQVVLHDNLKTAVLSRAADGTIHWNARYLDFAGYYGFTPKACQPYRPQTKGKVEAGVRYVRNNFWPGLRFVDLADLNRQAWDWLAGTANVRIHGTTGAVPFSRLAQEPLQSMFGKPVYDTALVSFRRTTKDCYVSYAGNYYSVPAEYARKTLQLKETEDERLLIFNAQDELITEHRVAAGHHQRIVVPAHYANIGPAGRPAKPPTAIQIMPVVSCGGLPAAPAVEIRALSWYEQLAEVVV